MFSKGWIGLKKVDATIVKETRFVALVTLILSALLQAVFLIISKWDYTVLLGNILGGAAAVGNFFIMGLTVQSALGMSVEDAKKRMKLSQSLRTLLLFAVAALGYLIPVFELLAVIIPYVFPRVAVALRAVSIKNSGEVNQRDKNDPQV